MLISSAVSGDVADFCNISQLLFGAVACSARDVSNKFLLVSRVSQTELSSGEKSSMSSRYCTSLDTSWLAV